MLGGLCRIISFVAEPGVIRHVGAEPYVALERTALEAALAFFDGLPPEATTSMQRDIAEGRPSELEPWSGAIVRLGSEANVGTSTHRVVHHALAPWERRARGELTFPADR